MQRYNVGILGATGLVGQHFARRLATHPWFRVRALAASERSVGRRYGAAVRWRLPGDPPAELAGLEIGPCATETFAVCQLVVSALDAAVAREIEPALAAAGLVVVSNSSACRLEPDVPLLIPEVNAAHLELVAGQRERRGGGFVVTNPNCSVAGLALVLAPLHRAFGVRRVVVTTLQAVSGAGVEGPRALDLVDNVIPHIPGEEEKIEGELGKILGQVTGAELAPAMLRVSAHCHRVATADGHLEAVSIDVGGGTAPEAIREALEGFRTPEEMRALPSSRDPLIQVRSEPDRPQPRLDRDCGEGMGVVVGRIRPCPVLGIKLELLSHNAVRGAAGAALLNAELLAVRGLLERRPGP